MYTGRKPARRKAVDGDALRVARVAANLTQEELAERWGLSRATIGTWESTSPPRWAADALAGLAASCKK